MRVNYVLNSTNMNDLIDTFLILMAFVSTAFKHLLLLYHIIDIIKIVEMIHIDLKFKFGSLDVSTIGKQSRVVFRVVYCAFWG